jgi:hypothetical protein
MWGRKERRQFIRLPFSREATLEGPSGRFRATLEDLSLSGARLRFGGEIVGPERGHYRLTAFLSPGWPVRMTVSLMYRRGDRAGFRCEAVDQQSLANLKGTLALYYGEGEALDAELNTFRSLFAVTGAE